MRIYLAGLECYFSYLEEANVKVRNSFISFYAMHKANSEILLRNVQRARQLSQGKIVCDSGAHSFFSENPLAGASASGHRKSTKTITTPDDYFELYKNFMHIAEPYVDYFVELDIGELVTQKKVEAWRKMLEREGLIDRIIKVYHPAVMSWAEFEETCRLSESKYVAVEGDRPLQRKSRLDYTRAIKIARAHDCKIHGFAMTKKNALDMYPFYSVDSSSWAAFIVWGSSSIVRDKSKHLKEIDSHRARTPEGRKHLYAQEVAAWLEREDYYTRLWEKRGVFWTE